jgi:lipopolysaccharide/colanic/teichoic acid biosynthesis glycosyltransferase
LENKRRQDRRSLPTGGALLKADLRLGGTEGKAATTHESCASIGFSPNWSRPAHLACKRAIDVAVSSVVLILLSPLLIALAVAVKLTSPGPVLYRWRVTGKDGRPFLGFKFRTMVAEADRMLDQLRDRNEMTGPAFKMRNDPRVTRLGRVLRRFSLDELPQLWSVLKGDMSLVGPRPTLVFEFEQLEEWQKTRVLVKPGAVSSWIVNGKCRDFDQRVRLDLEYIRCWSLWADVTILTKGLVYMLLGQNC